MSKLKRKKYEKLLEPLVFTYTRKHPVKHRAVIFLERKIKKEDLRLL